MFDYISGKFICEKNGQVTIDVNGLGYKIAIPASTVFKLPNRGVQLTLYVSFIVREFSHALYGFLEEQEREFFEDLLSVTGVGPKLALSILGTLPLSEFAIALTRKDINVLSKVPGIGKKTAERLIIEMKDKELLKFTVANGKLDNKSPGGLTMDAISTLINLGYPHSRAEKAVRIAMEENSDQVELSSLISLSLKHV